MKIKTLFFVLLIIFLSQSCHTAKSDLKEISNHTKKAIPNDSVRIVDKLSNDPLKDSLYQLDHAFYVDKHGFQQHYRSALEWNEASKLFVSAGLTNVIDDSLNIHFVDDWTKTFDVKTFDAVPYAITSQERTLTLLNLKEKKVEERFFLQNNVCRGLSKSGDKIIANIFDRKDYSQKKRKHLYDLIFYENNLSRIDTIFQDEGENKVLFYISPDGYKGYRKGNKVVVEYKGKGEYYSVEAEFYGMPIITKTNNAVVLKTLGSIRIYSLPKLEEIQITGYRGRSSIVQSTNNLLTVGEGDGKIRVYDLAKGEILLNKYDEFNKISHAGTNGKGLVIYSDKVDDEYIFRTLDIKKNEVLKEKTFAAGEVIFKGFSLDSKLFFYAFNDTIFSYNLETLEQHKVTSSKVNLIEYVHSNADHSIFGFLHETDGDLMVKMIQKETNKTWSIPVRKSGRIHFSKHNQFILIPNGPTRDSLTVYTIENEEIKKHLEAPISVYSRVYYFSYPRGRSASGYPDWLNNRKYWHSRNGIVKFNEQDFIEEKIELGKNKTFYGVDSKSNIVYYDRISNELFLESLVDRSIIKKVNYPFDKLNFNSDPRFYPDYSGEHEDLLVSNRYGTYYLSHLNDLSKHQIFHGNELHITPNMEYVVETIGKRIKIYKKNK